MEGRWLIKEFERWAGSIAEVVETADIEIELAEIKALVEFRQRRIRRIPCSCIVFRKQDEVVDWNVTERRRRFVRGRLSDWYESRWTRFRSSTARGRCGCRGSRHIGSSMRWVALLDKISIFLNSRLTSSIGILTRIFFRLHSSHAFMIRMRCACSLCSLVFVPRPAQEVTSTPSLVMIEKPGNLTSSVFFVTFFADFFVTLLGAPIFLVGGVMLIDP